MSGGTVNINGGIRVGSTNIETIGEEEPFEEILHPGTGTLTMTGGLISAADANALEIGTLDSTGWLELLGGTIKVGDLVIGENGGMNITKGTLILAGDKSETVLGYINSGSIIAYGGGVGTEVLYDLSDGKTTITAIPEPGTIALLGLGALVALRRRRKR
jgi:hypothetical protein